MADYTCTCPLCTKERASQELSGQKRMEQANSIGLIDWRKEYERVVTKNIKLNEEVRALMNMARYATLPPPILKQKPVEELLTTYDKFVQDMTFPQVQGMRDHMRGMVAEVGELNGKVYKADRDNRSEIDKQAMLLELGDILFYLVGVALEIGFSLEDVIRANKAKLTARKMNGTLQGSGDKR